MPYRRFGRVPLPRRVEGVRVWLELIAVEEYSGDLYLVLRYWSPHNQFIYYTTRVSFAYYYWDDD